MEFSSSRCVSNICSEKEIQQPTDTQLTELRGSSLLTPILVQWTNICTTTTDFSEVLGEWCRTWLIRSTRPQPFRSSQPYLVTSVPSCSVTWTCEEMPCASSWLFGWWFCSRGKVTPSKINTCWTTLRLPVSGTLSITLLRNRMSMKLPMNRKNWWRYSRNWWEMFQDLTLWRKEKPSLNISLLTSRVKELSIPRILNSSEISRKCVCWQEMMSSKSKMTISTILLGGTSTQCRERTAKI